MTIPQAVYLGAVVVYLVFFGLFLRFFYWKAYADLNFWRRKPYLDIEQMRDYASRKARRIPFFSIVVPARNEADVIGKTIDHMLTLNYPADRFEVLVVTDQKETRLRRQSIDGWIEQAKGFLKGDIGRTMLLPQARALVLALYTEDCVRYTAPWSAGLVIERAVLDVVREMADALLMNGGRSERRKLREIYRRVWPDGTRHAQAACAGYAALVACAFEQRGCESLHEDRVRRYARYWKALKNAPCDAPMAVMLERAGVALARRSVAHGAHLAATEAIDGVLRGLAPACAPTTQDIVDEKIAACSKEEAVPLLKHVVVPHDFDGRYNGRRTGWDVASTKGRALNYALSFLDPRSEMCGFYDAESRPDPDAVLYVAYRRLADGTKASLFQGPVFQVRNFYRMGPFCKIASLYQAIAHDWYLPALFKRLPFVGGTNLFISTRLLKDIGGYDYGALTEDLELGARAYLLKGAWPEYLPYYSSEQTPPTFNAFFRQRLRWGTGHLQVMDKIKTENRYPAARKRPLLRQLFIKGQLEWAVYQAATLVPPAVLTLWWHGLVDPRVLPETVRWVLNGFSGTYIAFTIYAYYRYMPYVDAWARPNSAVGRALVVLQLFFLPMAAFLFPVPYSSAMVLKAINKHPRTWVKTPRSRE